LYTVCAVSSRDVIVSSPKGRSIAALIFLSFSSYSYYPYLLLSFLSIFAKWNCIVIIYFGSRGSFPQQFLFLNKSPILILVGSIYFSSLCLLGFFETLVSQTNSDVFNFRYSLVSIDNFNRNYHYKENIYLKITLLKFNKIKFFLLLINIFTPLKNETIKLN
jgi:hypothetical protein